MSYCIILVLLLPTDGVRARSVETLGEVEGRLGGPDPSHDVVEGVRAELDPPVGQDREVFLVVCYHDNILPQST